MVTRVLISKVLLIIIRCTVEVAVLPRSASPSSKTVSTKREETGGASRPPTVPDGGWGWLVVFGSFLLQALTVGSAFTFGVVYVKLLDVYQQTESVTAWVGSIQVAVLYLTGLYSGQLIDRYGCRSVAMFGAFLSSLGFATSAVLPINAKVYPLYFTYGLCTGLGHGLMYMASSVVVQYYFDRRRGLATGLSAAGGGLGTLAFAYFTQWLLVALDLRCTLLVHAGLMLFGGLGCAALFWPLPVPDPARTVYSSATPASPMPREKSLFTGEPFPSETHAERNSFHGAQPSFGNLEVVSNGNCSDTEYEEEEDDDKDVGAVTQLARSKKLHQRRRFDKRPRSKLTGNIRGSARSLTKEMDDENERKPLLGGFPKNGVSEDDADGECSICGRSGSLCPRDEGDAEGGCCCEGRGGGEKPQGLGLCDVSLFRSPPYVMLCLAGVGFGFGIHVPYTYTPERAQVLLHLDADSAALLVSFMGLANVLSRLFCGWLGDRGGATLRYVMSGSAIVLCGVVTASISLFNTYRLLALYSCLFGTFFGCYAALFPVICVDMLGVKVISKSISQCLAVTSIPAFIASPISGLIIAGSSRNFDLAFTIFGSVQAVGGVLFFLTKCFRWGGPEEQQLHCVKQQQQQRQPQCQ